MEEQTKTNLNVKSLEEIEELRIKARNKAYIGVVITVVLVIVCYLIWQTPQALYFPAILGIVITVILITKPRREFLLAYKEKYVKESLTKIFTDLVYQPENGINYQTIANTQMMNMGDTYESNDYVSGKYKNINVEQADVHIQEEHESTDSDGNTTTYYVTIFKGRWMIFDFNKTFKANIQVCQKGFGNNRVNTIFGKSKYQKVSMESANFNDKFKTYAQSDHEAFYILTPSLMEKIERVTNSIKGKLLFCFVDNKLHVGIYNNVDSFEHSIFKKINEEEVLNSVSNDIKMITSFVDELNLDNDLFRKEA